MFQDETDNEGCGVDLDRAQLVLCGTSAASTSKEQQNLVECRLI